MDEIGVDHWPGAWAHCQTFGLQQGFKVRFNATGHIRFH
ncbi:hypothetical protein CCC_01608 [Paramagnetospirillum magnetotacticum MS-1]|uniref:Uncharacterized protein n=1 Tax=Paramagnetospirillum magnetotacticum MS-1 TaxID=272627 RepID=A0A0C2U5M2_PARME|nr:hypothetical protein CCC_01608 [Paramagnetospirillum magnetotacticum MS-1]